MQNKSVCRQYRILADIYAVFYFYVNKQILFHITKRTKPAFMPFIFNK